MNENEKNYNSMSLEELSQEQSDLQKKLREVEHNDSLLKAEENDIGLEIAKLRVKQKELQQKMIKSSFVVKQVKSCLREVEIVYWRIKKM